MYKRQLQFGRDSLLNRKLILGSRDLNETPQPLGHQVRDEFGLSDIQIPGLNSGCRFRDQQIRISNQCRSETTPSIAGENITVRGLTRPGGPLSLVHLRSPDSWTVQITL